MNIAIHAGHANIGGGAIGAVGFLNESIEARKVKDVVIDLLRQRGHNVTDCTVDNGTQSSVLTNIVKKHNSSGANYHFSIHFNAGANRPVSDNKTTGVECLIYPNSANNSIAKNICNSVSKLGFKNRGVKTNSSLYFLNKIRSGVLIECCFVDDIDDANLYNPVTMGRAIVEGILNIIVIEEPSTHIQTPLVQTKNFLVKVKIDDLNIRKGAGTEYDVVGVCKKNIKYTIVETKGNWGKLKSGLGWINISTKYVERV